MRRLLTAATIMFALDQVSKWLVIHRLDLLVLREIEVLPPYLMFRMGWNRGINFGLFADAPDAARWVMIAVAVAFSAWVVRWVMRDGLGRSAQVSAGLLLGGAAGNVLDRLLFGAVRDFLNMSCCGVQNPFVFNVADIGVFAGALGLVLFSGGGKSR